jgi:uncharacterized membrane protein
VDRQFWRALLGTLEGRVLLAGLLLSTAGIVGLGFTWLWSPAYSQVLVAMTATNVLFGRAAAMSFGYAVGLGHGVVVPVNMLVETVLVLLFYPLFVLSWRQVVEFRTFGNVIRRTREAAEANQDTIRRYGVLGLFAFVWFPFWMTGPVVGCAIGFLLGLSTAVNLAIVLTGTGLAMIGWAIVLRELHDRVAEFSVFGPMIMVIVIILAVVAGHLLHRCGQERRRARAPDNDRPASGDGV